MLIAPAYEVIQPSLIEPDILVAYSQVSGAFNLLPGGKPTVKIGEDDLAVYIKRLDLRTKVATGQSAYNQLPTVNPAFSYLSTPTYLTRVRAEWDHHDANAAGRWGASIQQLYRLGMRQGHFQFLRHALLYGVNPTLGEGIIHTPGVTAINLPPDSSNNDSIITYDNGEMGLFLLQTIGNIKTRTNNLGLPGPVTMLAPQRIIQQWDFNVVQLTSYQRAGGGTESTAGMVKGVANMASTPVTFSADDTLIGKGAGGTDLIIFALPTIEVPNTQDEINTNEFAKIAPGMLDCLKMYCDMVAPREITAPLPGGAVDVLSEHRHTSGWGVRPEAITLVSAAFQ